MEPKRRYLKGFIPLDEAVIRLGSIRCIDVCTRCDINACEQRALGEARPVGSPRTAARTFDQEQRLAHLVDLLTAVNDAEDVGKLLREEYGFRTQVLLKATGALILDAFD